MVGVTSLVTSISQIDKIGSIYLILHVFRKKSEGTGAGGLNILDKPVSHSETDRLIDLKKNRRYR